MSTLYLIENEVVRDFLKNSLSLRDSYRGIRLVSQRLQVQFRLKGKEAEESTCRGRLAKEGEGMGARLQVRDKASTGIS